MRSIEELWNEVAIDSPTLEVIFSEDRTCKAESGLRRDGLFQVWMFREVAGDGEFEPKVYWSPLGREVILTDSLDRAKAIAEDEIRSYTRR